MGLKFERDAMIETEQHTDLPSFLNSCIMDLKAKYPGLHDSDIARKLEISNSTFGRIKNADTKVPLFDNAIKIVRMACDEKDVMKFVKVHYPEMADNLKSIYPENSEVQFIKVENEKYFEDPTTYEVMLLVTSNANASREKVLEEFGKKGLNILEKLIAQGAVAEKDGVIGIQGDINAGQSTVHKLLQNLVKLSYDLEAFSEKDNWLTVQYEAVNAKEIMPVVRDILIKANKEIRKAFKDPRYKGDDVVWAGLVMDSLLKIESKEGGILQ